MAEITDAMVDAFTEAYGMAIAANVAIGILPRDPIAIDGARRAGIAAALAAAPQAAAQPAPVEAVKVKALEWNPFDAETPFGYTYRIYEEPGLDRKCWAVNLVDGRFDTIQEARNAAQADYERRILSTLSAPVEAKQPGAEEDERRLFEQWAKSNWNNGQNIPVHAWTGWLARAALTSDRKEGEAND